MEDQKKDNLPAIQTQSYSNQLVSLLKEGKYLTIGSHLPTRLDKCFHSPQVSILKTELGQDMMIALISKAVNECCIKSGTAMPKETITMLSASLLQDFWDLRFDEILFVLANGVKGEYAQTGKSTIYGQLTFPLIYEWFAAHHKDRQELFYNRHMDQKAVNAGDSARTMIATPVDKVIAGLNRIGMQLAEHKAADEKYFEQQAKNQAQ